MKTRLHKATLKIERLEISAGRQMLLGIQQNDERRYPLDEGTRFSVFTNQGTLHVQTAPGFVLQPVVQNGSSSTPATQTAASAA